MKLEVVVLAAGQGTRMKSEIPKVLHKVADKALLEHVVALATTLDAERISVVYGHGGERVLNELSDLPVHWVEQAVRLGTGHAVMQAQDFIGDTATILILYGDVPLLRRSTTERLLRAVPEDGLAILTVHLEDPKGYGRIVRDASGAVIRIVEEKDCNALEREIQEGNSGILAVSGRRLKAWLARLGNQNAQGEYYLTDIVELAVADGVNVNSTSAEDADEVLGVNDRQQLAHLERVYQARVAMELMQQGVTLRDPKRLDVRGQIEVEGQDIEIDVNVVLEGHVRLGHRVRIGANTTIRNSTIADDVVILPNCHIEEASIGRDARIGPFARVRPGSVLSDKVHVGNFVETKKALVGEGSKINHLSYIGDADIGAGVNIGAGTITCNYDGVNKFKTTIEDGAFIGSDTQLIAPVRVGRNATVGAGSTITKEVPADQLTLGRSKQVTIAGWKRPTRNED